MKYSRISGRPVKNGEAIRLSDIREGVLNYILKLHPECTTADYISIDELNLLRRQYLSTLILEEKGELADLDNVVLQAISSNSIFAENIHEEPNSGPTPGQRIADRVAQFGGSWKFIISFFLFIVTWIAINLLYIREKPFDPYPFILLNLMLSCVAALQAPIIMMSQNRQEQKDRKRSELDYKINLKAELEIKLLSEKIDHLIVHQNKKLLEIQEIQTDYLEDLIRAVKNRNSGTDQHKPRK